MKVQSPGTPDGYWPDCLHTVWLFDLVNTFLPYILARTVDITPLERRIRLITLDMAENRLCCLLRGLENRFDV